MNNTLKFKKLGLLSSFAIYIPAAALIFVLSKYLIPYLSKITGQENILFWFIVAGLGVFTPLIITGYILIKKEGLSFTKEMIKTRLRFRPLTKKDIIWSIAGLVLVGICSGIILKVLEWLVGEFDPSPSFMMFEPLNKGRYWLLLIWLPYWILNILGEEFLWRGVILPRQEIAFGKYAWLVNGGGWLLFHVVFGWQLLVTMLPILFIQPYLVQKTKNSWLGVIIHGGLNAPSFLAICFGLI